MSNEHIEELNDQQIVRREKWQLWLNKASILSELDLNAQLLLVN